MKKLLKLNFLAIFLCTLMLGINRVHAAPLNQLESEIGPRSVVEYFPYYGYCSGNRIVRQYLAPVSTPTGIAHRMKKMEVSFAYDGYFGEYPHLPFVKYAYVTNLGRFVIPLENSYTPGTIFQVDTGDFGSCPSWYGGWEDD